MKKISLFLSVLFVSLSLIQANDFTQTIRGQVVDKITRMPLPGATIVILDSNPLKGTITDLEGYFTLEDVSVGRISLQVNYLGYRPVNLDNLNVISGKELVIKIEMEENVIEGEEIVIKAHVDKTKPLNKMSSTSARTFSVEESQRYAGARNDVARMAANYAGVGTANDASNDIVIRGNSPDGLLWRLEGVTIPNPNHFGFMGATGGPVSMLNNNVLANSDFMTGAFPADYGNAMSGVFDLKMRDGNYEKYEFLGQVGFNGFEAGIEGPVSRKNHSSFLINYRYSTLGLMNKLGCEFGTGTAVPFYQDLVFKVNMPTKKAGKFELVGFGGISHIDFIRSEMDSADLNEGLYNYENLDVYSKSSSGSLILNHTYPINEKTYSRISLAATGILNSNYVDSVSTETRIPVAYSRNHFSNVNLIASAYLISKINRKNSVKAGFEFTNMGFGFHDSTLVAAEERFITYFESEDAGMLYQGSVLWQHKINDYLVLNSGLHYQCLGISKIQIVEPRIGMRWQFAQNSSLNFGYGLHSMMVPLYTYFVQVETDEGNMSMPNKNLDFMKSHHFVVGYDQKFANSWRLKTEAYYQSIYDAVIERDKKSSFSLLNKSWTNNYMFDSLMNGGKGRNIGLELTVEKFLDNGFYCLFTASVFDSKYTGSDGIWRSTAFDGDYILNLLGGKELQIMKNGKKNKSKKWLSFDGRISFAGGQRYTPVDIVRSMEDQKTVYQNDIAFTERFKDYFRADIRIGLRLDHKRFSQEWVFDIQNITNRINPLYMMYNSSTAKTEFVNQLGFMPMMQYRIVF
jgi:hypothetical protein